MKTTLLRRPTWVWLHRWAGLYMALFLTVAGLTGSLLAFLHELSGLIDPPPAVQAAGRPLLDPLRLREITLAQIPHAQVNGLDLHPEPSEAVTVYVEAAQDPATGKPFTLDAQGLVLDPYSGAVLKRLPPQDPQAYPWWPITRSNLLGFIYALHYSLAIPGSWGVWLFGVAALLWTIDCAVSFYLTLPPGRPRGHERRSAGDWWRRWQPSWWVKWPASFYRVNFDLHRAFGLWTFAMLFVFAWSSVAFNLGEQVYQPVMTGLFGMDDPLAALPKLDPPREQPLTPMPDALARARAALPAAAEDAGVQVQYEQALYYDKDHGQWLYVVRSERDLSDHGGQTLLVLDDATHTTGPLVLPTGQNGGRTFTNWLLVLHMAGLWGLPMKIFVCLMGLVIAMLSVTGVYLWWKKRRARQHRPDTLSPTHP